MGLLDIIQPTLLASRDTQHFILVSLRISQQDTEVSLMKLVLRRGTAEDYKVRIESPNITDFSPVDVQAYSLGWEEAGVSSRLVGEGEMVHQPEHKKILILTRYGNTDSRCTSCVF